MKENNTASNGGLEVVRMYDTITVNVEVADAIACNNCPDLTLDEYDLFTGGLTNPKYYRCANIEICQRFKERLRGDGNE